MGIGASFHIFPCVTCYWDLIWFCETLTGEFNLFSLSSVVFSLILFQLTLQDTDVYFKTVMLLAFYSVAYEEFNFMQVRLFLQVCHGKR